MKETPEILNVDRLSVVIPLPNGDLNAARDVTLCLNRGETLGIVGESGSGKSITALAIMNLLPKQARRHAGAITLGQTDLLRTSEKELSDKILGKRIGMIFQEPMTSLNPVYTIGRQLCETMLKHRKGSMKQARERAIHLLEKVGIPGAENRLKCYPHQLSGGQRQRVMIAMALMNDPELLIADEPTTALDVTVQAQILHLLKQLQSEFGMSLILITHDLGVVSRMSDRVAVMYAGQIVESGPVDEVLTTPKHPYTKGLLSCMPDPEMREQELGAIPGSVPSMIGEQAGCSFAPRCPRVLERCRDTIPEKIFLDTGQNFLCHNPEADGPKAEVTGRTKERGQPHETPFITMQDIRQVFTVRPNFFKPQRHIRAVDGVDLDIRRGEVVALVGESGCGKSTLARIVLGLDAPVAGSVLFDGKPISDVHNHRRARLIQPIFQDPFLSLNPRRTIGEIIRRPLEIQKMETAAWRESKTFEIMEMVGLPRRFYHRYPNQLSGGQRQRAAIARAIIMKPDVVICDEPTSALDVSVQSQILNLLLDLRDELNLTYLFISHDLSVVGYMANRIAVMYLGKIVEIGRAEDIFDNPLHPYTKGLLGSVLPISPGEAIPKNSLGEGFANPLDIPEGCSFHPRCPMAAEDCSTIFPELIERGNSLVRCPRVQR